MSRFQVTTGPITVSYNPFEIPMLAPRLLLDMDGVIADFCTPSIRAHGKTDLPLTRLTADEWRQLYLDEAELDCFWGPERDEVMFYEAPKWAYFEDWGLDLPTFWQPIREMGHDFWENLPVLPWGPALVRHVAKLDPGFLFVTYPDSHPGAYSGKYAWLQKHFPEYADKLVPIRDKTVLARPNWLLIDDAKKQVDGFREAGGAALLWPARYNRSDSPDTFLSPIIRDLPALFTAITNSWWDLSVEPPETVLPAARESILEEATRITRGSRQEAYGHPYDNFTNTAQIATPLLAKKLRPGVSLDYHDIGLLLLAVKLSRQVHLPKRGNLVDVAGYSDCIGRAITRATELLAGDQDGEQRSSNDGEDHRCGTCRGGCGSSE